MPTDFRDGKTFPRRGREKIAEFMWLARLADKGRAKLAGTIHDYIYPCPIDRGMLEAWGVSVPEFEAALAQHTSDAALRDWLAGCVPAGRREAANAWLVAERSENMDRQDAEEGVPA